MDEIVHVIPVGFDYERLLHPISKGDLDADRIRLIDSDRPESDPPIRKLANRWLKELQYTFSSHLDYVVEVDSINGANALYDYKRLYEEAHKIITEERDQGNTVWINISSMPRTVAFAFATAANACVVERPEDRESIHTYYVKPKDYYAPQMYGELQKQQTALERWAEEVDTPDTEAEIRDRLQAVNELVTNIERKGLTEGAAEIDEQLYVEFPAAPLSNLRDFEEEILRCLDEHQPMRSTSALARELGASRGIEKDSDNYESFRSKVQYNVDKLENKGYVVRNQVDNRKETKLSVMGELWITTDD